MGELYELFPAIRETGLSVAFHNEDAAIVRRLTQRFLDERRNTPESHGAGRPAVAEVVANAAVFEIARVTGVRCHIVHSSLARGIEQAKRYREEGVAATAETCVQYLVFEESQVLTMGARLKQNPPIRPAHERAALWEKVVADEVDFVSSDHVAWPLSRKSNPAFSENGSGVPGLETLFAALYTGMVTERGLAPSRVARLGTAGAALRPLSPQGAWRRCSSRPLDLRRPARGATSASIPVARARFTPGVKIADICGLWTIAIVAPVPHCRHDLHCRRGAMASKVPMERSMRASTERPSRTGRRKSARDCSPTMHRPWDRDR